MSTALFALARHNLLDLMIRVLFLMPRNRKNKGRSPQKGRGRVTRKTNRASKLSSGRPTIDTMKGLAGFTDEVHATLKFSDSYILSFGLTGGSYQYVAFSLNGLSPCNLSTSSGQPQYFTQYSAVYQKYVVFRSRFRWRLKQLWCLTSGGSGAGPTGTAMPVCVIYPQPSGASAVSSIRAAAAQQYAKRHDFQIEEKATTSSPTDISIISNNPRSEWIGSMVMDVAKLDGEPNLRTSLYESAVSTNPTNIPSWIIGFQDVLADSLYKGVFLFEVDLFYDVFFFDRKAVADSSLLGLPAQLFTAGPVPPSPSSREEKKTEQKDSVNAEPDWVSVSGRPINTGLRGALAAQEILRQESRAELRGPALVTSGRTFSQVARLAV